MDQRIVWEFETGDRIRSSPTVIDGTVFVGSHDYNVYAVDAASGKQQWATETEGCVISSPTVVDGTVFVGSDDNHVYALDAASGEQQWTAETGDRVRSSPTVVDGTVFVGSLDNHIYALDEASGEQQWTADTGRWITSSPTVVDETVFVGGSDGSVYALNVASGEQQWAAETGNLIESSPTVVDSTVFVTGGSGNVYALDAASGEPEWTAHIGLTDSSPTVVNGTVFVGSFGGTVYALDAGSGEQLWTVETNDRVSSSPTVVGGIVLVGSDDNCVYALDAASGEQQWSVETDSWIRSSPTVVDGTAYIGSYDYTIYALDADVEGSSEGSRVLLGTLGHHGVRHDQQQDGQPESASSRSESLSRDGLSVRSENVSLGKPSDEVVIDLADVGPDSIPVPDGFSITRGSLDVERELTDDDGLTRVFEGYDGNTGRKIAIKELSPGPERTLGRNLITFFEKEAELWERLQTYPGANEHIARLYDYGNHRGIPWIAVEYMDGGSLRDQLTEIQTNWRISQRLWLCIRIADALCFAHRHNTSHLDIKPANILFRKTKSGTVDVPVLSDWGLAQSGLSPASLRDYGFLTPAYAAPEQHDPDRFGSQSQLTDVYQLSVVAYELLAGSHPFRDEFGRIIHPTDERPSPPSDTNDRLPNALDDVVLTGLAPKPADRHGSMAQLRSELTRLGSGESNEP